jgi:NADPH-dependent curcumin reductase CurA
VAINHRVVLAHRPDPDLTVNCFALAEAPIPEPAEGQALLRTEWLSIDPTIRGWLRAGGSYLPEIAVGDVVRSIGVGQVVASRTPKLPEGTVVQGLTGWQEYALISPADALPPMPLPPGLPVEHALTVCGITGLTAYLGISDLAKPMAGETVVVSAAAGGVGSIAGQLARLAGARVIGIAGTDSKCAWITNTLGFNAAVNYRTNDLKHRLAELAPAGVNVYFDNVGGATLRTLLDHLAVGARIVLCGAISDTGETSPPNLANLIMRGAHMHGLLLTHHLHRITQAAAVMAEHAAAGRIITRLDILDGLAAAPEALIGLLTGNNTGKRVVHLT